jgi:hypothetical protein
MQWGAKKLIALQNYDAAYEAIEGMEDVEIAYSSSSTLLHELLISVTDVGMQTDIFDINHHCFIH